MGIHDPWSRRRCAAVSALLCLDLFVDVTVPVLGTVSVLVGLAAAPFLLFGDLAWGCWRTWSSTLLLLPYFLIPTLVYEGVDRGASMSGLVDQGLLAVVALAACAPFSTTRGRRDFCAIFLLFAAASSGLAVAQREGRLPALGRDLWGRAATSAGELRGQALMADPNFLGVLLAAGVPLALSLTRWWARIPTFALLGVGLWSTNSRAGLLLGLIGLGWVALRSGRVRGSLRRTGERPVLVMAVASVGVVMALNVGEQRDRLVTGFSAVLSGSFASPAGADTAALMSSVDRREYLFAWLSLGVDRFPIGAGVNAQEFIHTASGRQDAAHNNFVHLVGQGGVSGLLIGVITVLSFLAYIRFRREPLAMVGALTVIGGLFLSYPGTSLLLLPMAVADGLTRAAPSRHSDALPERVASSA